MTSTGVLVSPSQTVRGGAHPATTYAPPFQRRAPLIVDVDGCLVRGDLLWEGVLALLARRPLELVRACGALRRGRAAFKARVAASAELDVGTLPLDSSVLALIEAAHAGGQPVWLMSGADASQLSVLAARVNAACAYGSTAERNLTGQAKLALAHALCEMHARAVPDYAAAVDGSVPYAEAPGAPLPHRGTAVGFDYVGNARVDLPLWRGARRAYVANATWLTRRLARRARPDAVILPHASSPSRSVVRALRPHQWGKNALLLLPALAAHVSWRAHVLVPLGAGIAAFSLTASAIYIVNDLLDRPHDRAHPTKRTRPFACGALSVRQGLGLTVALLAGAAYLAGGLSPTFRHTLAGYAALSCAYSVALKRRPALDVLTLATLYALRVVAGAALVTVALSRWFLAFSLFLFLSLALVKRVTELRGQLALASAPLPGLLAAALPGRDYCAADYPVLISLGCGATVASALVYCLYLTGPEVVTLYHRPDLLWAGLPLILYWQARVWLFAVRGAMHDDPVVFALRDRVSLLVALGFLLLVLAAV